MPVKKPTDKKSSSSQLRQSTTKKPEYTLDTKAMNDRISQNVHQFSQDVAFIEHCALIYGEEAFRQALQAIKPYREKYSKHIDSYINQTVFDPWDEDWFHSEEELKQSYVQPEKEQQQVEDHQDLQQMPQNKSVEYQNYNYHEPVFMPPKQKQQTDYLQPFINQNIKIRKLNDAQVVVQTDKYQQVINSRILQTKQ